MTVQGNTVTPQIIKNKIRSIRPLPVAVQKLYALVGDVNSKIEDVSQTISSDEMLSSKILQIANSSFYGFTSNISSIPQAVSVMGFQSIRSLALSISVSNMDTGTTGKQHREAIWKDSFLVGSAARMIASRLRLKSPEDAFAAGIVHDIGQLVLLQSFPSQYGQLITQSQQNQRLLIELENRYYQMDHMQIGGLICQHWKLPSPILRAVVEHHKPLNDKFPFSEETSLSYILKRATRLVNCLDIEDKAELDQQFLAISQHWANKSVVAEIFKKLPDEIKNIEAFLSR